MNRPDHAMEGLDWVATDQEGVELAFLLCLGLLCLIVDFCLQLVLLHCADDPRITLPAASVTSEGTAQAAAPN